MNMALDGLGLAGAALNFGTTLAGSLVQNAQTRASSRAASSALRTQGLLGLSAAARENEYSNLEYANQIWNLMESKDIFKGKQLAYMGATGFDVSTGENRLLADTERRFQEQNTELNRQAYLETFERFHQAYMDKIQYDAQAKIHDVNAKYASGWRGTLSAFSNATLSALGGYFQFAQPNGRLQDVGVQGSK